MQLVLQGLAAFGGIPTFNCPPLCMLETEDIPEHIDHVRLGTLFSREYTNYSVSNILGVQNMFCTLYRELPPMLQE